MPNLAASVTVESRFIPAPDGLSLHVRCYEPAADSPQLPVLCLPGLTRNEADFTSLATYLAADRTVQTQIAVPREMHPHLWRGERAKRNIGHLQTRMTFVARREPAAS